MEFDLDRKSRVKKVLLSEKSDRLATLSSESSEVRSYLDHKIQVKKMFLSEIESYGHLVE